MTSLSILTPSKVVAAYLASPGGEGPWPGVVVLHDIMGFTHDVRRQADWLASLGYLSIAPDLYSGGGMLRCVRATFRSLQAREGGAFDDIEAARCELARRADCTGRIGVIGFCMGGGFALVAAAHRGFAASSVNYGTVPRDAVAVLSGACPVIGSFGARDPALRGAAAKLERALDSAGVEHDIKEYPNAGHAFMNDHGGLPNWIMARFGMGLNAAAAADAQSRIHAFFDRHLR